ncbi:hypothetical protein Tco_0514242 [Tanacetum coccineum]
MGSRISKIFGMSRVTSKGSAPELVKRETDTRVTRMVDALKHSETLCAITMRYMLRMERTNLGNSPTASIKGKGDVIHIWKESKLTNTLYVPEIPRNLVPGWLLIEIWLSSCV